MVSTPPLTYKTRLRSTLLQNSMDISIIYYFGIPKQTLEFKKILLEGIILSFLFHWIFITVYTADFFTRYQCQLRGCIMYTMCTYRNTPQGQCNLKYKKIVNATPLHTSEGCSLFMAKCKSGFVYSFFYNFFANIRPFKNVY